MSDEQDTDLTQFDLSLKKKKKRVKPVDSSIPIEEKQQEQQEYDYTFLLDRLYRSLREQHPNLVSRKKTVIPVPVMIAMGSKKSMWVNFSTTLQIVHRPPEHLQSYIISELNSTCSIDSNSRLLIRGKFTSKHLQTVMQKYMTNYVACQMCHGSDTLLIKDTITRIYFMNCESCGSSRSVQPIKNGYTHGHS
jgi:translation initiation factor 2 subunit 2